MPRKPARPTITYPLCVRHLKPRKDVRLRNFFLCNDCSALWTKEAFDSNAPLYVSEAVEGYCLLCNRVRKDVRMRTWFLCDICARVAGSIGRNHVAEQAILEFWKTSIKPRYRHLALKQNDISALLPRRDTDVSGEGPIDFLVRDTQLGRVVLGIENKTGRSAIYDMSQFQLDVSDCEAITNDMRKLNVPAYLIHAQVLEKWRPPTLGFEIIGLWWSDVYRMAENFKGVSMRRDEMRGAAYFSKRAFQPIETFADQLMGKRGLALVERFKKDGIPRLYRIS